MITFISDVINLFLILLIWLELSANASDQNDREMFVISWEVETWVRSMKLGNKSEVRIVRIVWIEKAYNFLNIIIMMQSFLSCFACGDKNETGVVISSFYSGRSWEYSSQPNKSRQVQWKRNVSILRFLEKPMITNRVFRWRLLLSWLRKLRPPRVKTMMNKFEEEFRLWEKKICQKGTIRYM